MFEHLHMTAKVGWIGKAEEAAGDLSWDYFVMYSLAGLAVSIFVCWCTIIQLQLYQMCPGWGPVRKFDHDGTEEMRINQLLMHEEKQGVGHNLKGDKRKGDENLLFMQGMLNQAKGEVTGLVDEATKKAKRLQAGGDLEEGEQSRDSSNGLYT